MGRCFGINSVFMEVVPMLEGIHIILVFWIGGDGVKVFGGKYFYGL